MNRQRGNEATRQLGNEATRQEGTENAETPKRRNAETEILRFAQDDKAVGLERVVGDPVACREATGAPIVRVRLSPANTVNSKNGTFIVDKESWRLIEAEFRSHGSKLQIDLEHESLMENIPPKDRIGAVGWIEDLEFNDEGLFAKVQWNDEGRSRILTDRFRYISPVFIVRKADKKAIRAKSAGLTNEPAIPNQERVAAKEEILRRTQDDKVKLAGGQRKDVSMMGEMNTIAEKLGLAADATVENILSRIGELLKKGEEAATPNSTVNSVCKALGLKADAGESEIVVAINSHKQNATSADAAKKELAALNDRVVSMEAQKLIDAAVSANKINPNAKEDLAICTQLAKEKPDAFNKLMAERQPLIPPGRTTPPEGGATAGDKSREGIIVNSAKKFKEDPSLGKLTNCKDFVSLALQDAGQARLSEEESKKIGG